MATFELSSCLTILGMLYFFGIIFAVLGGLPMIMHVYPLSECLLFSSSSNQKLFYGSYISCNFIGYVHLIVGLGSVLLLIKCFMEKRLLLRQTLNGHKYELRIKKVIILVHVLLTSCSTLLVIITTAGYIVACNSIHHDVRHIIQEKLNANPYDTRGEEIRTRFEDDYKFDRYVNRWGNAYGAEFYNVAITCRAIFTDPEIYQRLHDTHYSLYSRYYGYWFAQDLFAYDSQKEAIRINALIESSLAGGWLSLAIWIIGLFVIIVQRIILNKKQIEQDRVSVHSMMMGNMPVGQFKRDGSIISSKSNSMFQRGGSMRGSDRSMRSRRDIDDLALNLHVNKNSSSKSNPNINNYVIRNQYHYRPNDITSPNDYLDLNTRTKLGVGPQFPGSPYRQQRNPDIVMEDYNYSYQRAEGETNIF